MESIFYRGIFTSHGFLAIIFIALAVFLFYKVKNTNQFSNVDKKVFIMGVSSLVVGIIFAVMYVIHINTII